MEYSRCALNWLELPNKASGDLGRVLDVPGSFQDFIQPPKSLRIVLEVDIEQIWERI